MIFLWIIIVILGVWLGVLTWMYRKMQMHYNSLIKATNKQSLQDILGVLLKQLGTAKKDIEILRARCDTIEKEGKLHIQKIGLLRFNPFEDTGGNQSFIIALVDSNNTGVIISGLYARAGTRWYAKRVVKGKGVEHELSEHEKKALNNAEL